MKALEGTPMLALWLNVMGAHISPRAVLGAYSQVIDPDMITIDAHSTVTCSFQVHTFEDRVLKINHLHVHEGATVMEAAVAMYGVDVGTNAHVSANSCIMKNEHLAPGKSYSGVPVNHMDEELAYSYEKDLESGSTSTGISTGQRSLLRRSLAVPTIAAIGENAVVCGGPTPGVRPSNTV